MPKDFADEYSLLKELRKRNPKAFEYLYLTSRNPLFVLALSIVKSEEIAKDILQEFFTDFWQFRLYESIQKSVNVYLFFSIKNRAINHYREERSYKTFMRELASNEAFEIPHYFENEELRVLIQNKINELSPMASKTFTMHYIDNLSHQEIADKLRLSKQTVSNHIHRALKELRASIKKSL